MSLLEVTALSKDFGGLRAIDTLSFNMIARRNPEHYRAERRR